MSIFDLHSQVLADYRDFVRSFFTIADDRTREFVDRALDEEARLWPDPLLQVSPSYAGMVQTQVTAQGWLGSTPEGRRPQIRGWRAGGSLAVASSTPATPLLSPAKIRELNHAPS